MFGTFIDWRGYPAVHAVALAGRLDRRCHIVEYRDDELHDVSCQAAILAAFRHASNASARKRR